MIAMQQPLTGINIITVFKRLTILIIPFIVVSHLSAVEIDIQYNSLYVSEGRNNLDKGGIVWLSGTTDVMENLAVGLVYGRSTSNKQDYDELNATLTYSNTVGEFGWYVGLNRLEFFEDNAHDTEVGGGISYAGYEIINVFADAYYSTQANGTFMEVGISSPFNLAYNLDITPYVVAGFDFGYASEAYNGYNHLGVGAQLDYIYSEDIGMYFRAELIQAGSDIKRDLGKSENEALLGFGLVSRF